MTLVLGVCFQSSYLISSGSSQYDPTRGRPLNPEAAFFIVFLISCLLCGLAQVMTASDQECYPSQVGRNGGTENDQ